MIRYHCDVCGKETTAEDYAKHYGLSIELRSSSLAWAKYEKEIGNMCETCAKAIGETIKKAIMGMPDDSI